MSNVRIIDRSGAGGSVRVVDRNTGETLRADAPRIAHCRVHLKIASLAYGEARHGADACEPFTHEALLLLCSAAIRYYEALTGMEPGRRFKHGDQIHMEGASHLKLAALAYRASRHGVDQHLTFTTTALSVLCEAAVRYYEAASGERRREGIKDPEVSLGDGTKKNGRDY